MMLSGSLPHKHDDRKKTHFEFSDGFRNVAASAKDLITNLLQVDPAKRFTLAQVEAHEWFCQPKGRGVVTSMTPRVKSPRALRTQQNLDSAAGAPQANASTMEQFAHEDKKDAQFVTSTNQRVRTRSQKNNADTLKSDPNGDSIARSRPPASKRAKYDE